MAEIPLERKPRRSVLPLVLLLLIVAAAAWYFWSRSTVTTTSPTDSTGVRTDSAVVRDTAPRAPGTP